MTLAIAILLKVTATTALALIAARLARRNRAAVRHVLLAAAFAILLALPVASLITPPVHITLPIARRTISGLPVAEPVAMMLAAAAARATEARSASASAAAPSLPTASTMLLIAWLAGTLLLLVRLTVGFRQTLWIRRTALPWRHASLATDRCDLLLHEAVPGPMTCGIARPAIILPVDARSWTRADLSRAIVHEREHVRRGDWLTQAIARCVAACYWFHPLVWIALRQFVLEAERACDDAVLRRADATEYADQLVTLAQRMRRERGAALVAMARHGDLPSRVRALLDRTQRRGPAGVRWITFAAMASALLVATMSAIEIVASQKTDESSQRFEVASIKPCKDGSSANGMRRPDVRIPSPGHIFIDCVTLERLMYYAYAGLGGGRSPLLNTHPLNENVVRGGPGWVRSEQFNIEAKAQRADRGTLIGPMLRALLEERFDVKTHRGTEEAPLYALTVAKGGFKLKPIANE